MEMMESRWRTDGGPHGPAALPSDHFLSPASLVTPAKTCPHITRPADGTLKPRPARGESAKAQENQQLGKTAVQVHVGVRVRDPVGGTLRTNVTHPARLLAL